MALSSVRALYSLTNACNVVSGLADDNKVELDSSEGFRVVPQGVECHAVHECLNLRHRVENVPYALGPRSDLGNMNTFR